MSLWSSQFSPRRRRLLWGMAGALASPMAGAARAPGPQRALRVGVAMAPSTRYPRLSEYFVAGFRGYLAASGGRAGGHPLELVPIDCAGNPRQAMLALDGAVQSGRFDLLCGLANRNHAAQLRPALERTATPFIVADAGADVVRAHRDSPYLIRNSLGYWQANHAMGAWSHANLGARVLIAADFLESGYDMVHAFRRAFEARGGEVVGTEVTGLPNGAGTFDDVARETRRHRPDFVYAFYSGPRADAFLHYYEGEGLARTTPLAGPGMLTDSIAANSLSRNLAGIVTAAGWDAGDEPFAMLGAETAQRIDVALDAVHGGLGDLAAALARVRFAGPRGQVAALEGMAEASVPTYIRRLSATPAGLANVTTARLPPLAPGAPLHEELRTTLKSGWLQAYLAA
jgi:branched-chain amino acid transport system substrate-binding protein